MSQSEACSQRAMIVVFAFGQPDSIISNQFLASTARKVSMENYVCDIYTQRDIVVLERGSILVHYFPDEDERNPPPTLRLARWCAKCALQNEVEEIALVAAGPHMWRVCRDMTLACAEIGICPMLVAPFGELEDTPGWFCPESVQSRTRSWWRWWPREFLLRLLPVWLYKKIAS
jgi:hypothetical protein